MPLFKRQKDINLFRHLNKQLILKIIDTTISVYKINSIQSSADLYGQSLKRIYFPDVSIGALIQHDTPTIQMNQFGHNYLQAITVRFDRDILKDINLYPQIGDVIQWNGNYYQISTSIQDQLIAGQQSQIYNWSITCDCVITRKSIVQIQQIHTIVSKRGESSIYD